MAAPADTPIDSMRNLGPKSQAWLAEIDIADETALRAIGAVEAYARLRFRFGRKVSRNMLFALAGSLDGIDWRHLSAEDKAELDRQAVARLTGANALGIDDTQKSGGPGE